MVFKSNYVRANTFLLFPGLPLVEYAKQKGYLDKDFDIEKHVAEATEINIKTPYDKEFRNIAALFWLMVKFSPRWIPFFKKVVSLPDNIVFRIIGSFNMMQELLFYRVRPIPALRYFKNTVLMTNKSQLSMTMRMWPTLFKRKERDRRRAAAEADFRSQPRLFLMFTWEEAGQLRSMLLVIKWGLLALVAAVILFEHEPLGAALNAGFHSVETRLHRSPSAAPAVDGR